jgi:predicted lipoprotein with Yx(FWY)xxD motif
MRSIPSILAVVAALTLTSCSAVRRPAPADSDSPPARVVVDADGFTLYRFERGPHSATPNGSVRVDEYHDRRRLDCDAGTPDDWPLVSYRPRLRLPGIDPRRIGRLERADGTTQLAIDGCPVYRYAGDRAPGEFRGDRLGGEWFAIRV